MRTEVRAFAEMMEAKLAMHDDDWPGWKHETKAYLFNRLQEEVDEPLRAMTLGRDVGQEAADVANFAMMIADRCGCLGGGE